MIQGLCFKDKMASNVYLILEKRKVVSNHNITISCELHTGEVKVSPVASQVIVPDVTETCGMTEQCVSKKSCVVGVHRR